MTLHYKPDAMIYLGLYKGNAASQVAIYSSPRPCDRLVVHQANRSSLHLRVAPVGNVSLLRRFGRGKRSPRREERGGCEHPVRPVIAA
jgi:hypothetical protein